MDGMVLNLLTFSIKPAARRDVILINVPWYLRKRVNAVIEACLESGLMERFRSCAEFAFRLKNGWRSVDACENPSVDLAFVWLELAVGLVLASAVFCMEWRISCRN